VLPGEDAFPGLPDRLPATIELSFFALLIAVSLGIPLGYFAAAAGVRPSTTDR
jgi:peptide/nickel transport system permease protein